VDEALAITFVASDLVDGQPIAGFEGGGAGELIATASIGPTAEANRAGRAGGRLVERLIAACEGEGEADGNPVHRGSVDAWTPLGHLAGESWEVAREGRSLRHG